MLGFLGAYLGWSIKTNASKLSNIKMSFYLFIALLCARISSEWNEYLEAARYCHKKYI